MIYLKRFLHYILSVLHLIQRLPMFLVFVLGVTFTRGLYLVFKWHRPMIVFVQGWLRVMFLLNGVWVRVDDSVKTSLKTKGAVIVNFTSVVDYAILFMVLPYQKILTLPKSFFDYPMVMRLGAVLGLFPSETNYDIHQYQRQTFHIEPYLKSGFHTVEFVLPLRFLDQPIPYSVVVSIKCQKPIICLQLIGSEQIQWATIWSPKVVQLSFLDMIHVNRRPELMITRYHTVMQLYQAYEKSRVLK